MTMRDPVDMAAQLLAKSEFYRFHALNKERSALLVALIREAQEDGARHATCPHCGPGTDLNTALNQLGDERIAVGWAKESITRLEAQVAALTERAERAEQVARSFASWISGEIDDEIDQGRADFLMSKMDEFILKLKEKP